MKILQSIWSSLSNISSKKMLKEECSCMTTELLQLCSKQHWVCMKYTNDMTHSSSSIKNMRNSALNAYKGMILLGPGYLGFEEKIPDPHK